MKVNQEHIISLIERAGLALYGDRWKTALATDLGVTYRTLQNWLDRSFAVKAGEVLPKLHERLAANHKDLEDVIADVRAGMTNREDN